LIAEYKSTVKMAFSDALSCAPWSAVMTDPRYQFNAETMGYPLLKIGDVCRQQDVSPSAVTRWISKGTLLGDGSRVKLKATAVPGGWRIDRRDLAAFLSVVTKDRLAELGAAEDIRTPGEDDALKKDLAAAGLLD
jgi:hypothetical protein